VFFVRSSGTVVKVPAAGGSQKKIGHGFDSPAAVAVDAAGNAYVADRGNDRVVKVPANGGKQHKVGSGLSAPRGVSVDATGHIFISDTGNKRVVKVSSGGKQHAILKDVARVIAATAVAK
jgi:sugar lactone lactonase YvrE